MQISSTNQTALFCKNALRFCKGLTLIPVALAANVAAVWLRIIAAILNTCGATEKAKSLKYEAKKFQVLYVDHNIDYLVFAPFTVLTPAKNLIKRDLVAREEDTKTIRVMLNQLQMPATSRGAQSSGICFGATLSVIKACLDANISTEAALIDLMKQYAEGFDRDAAGLQKVYNKTGTRRTALIDSLQPEFDVLLKEEQNIDFSDPGQKEAHSARCLQYQQKADALKIQYYNDIAKLVDLRVQSYLHFNDFKANEETRRTFDNLPEGLYHINPENDHAIAYLKFSFGSYILDPTYGLMPLDHNSPSKSIAKICKSASFDASHYST